MPRPNAHGAWADCPAAPPDADSTAFALRTRKLLGGAAQAGGLLGFFDDDARAFATFHGGAHRELRFDPGVENNLQIHPEVNANIYLFLVENGLDRYLCYELVRQSQSPEGWWRSYFYPSRFYATCLYLRLLHMTGKCTDAKDRGVNYLLASQKADGSWGENGDTYETALALNGLAECEAYGKQFLAGIAYLVSVQEARGGWHSKAPIWIYHRGTNPLVFWRGFDGEGVVCSALAARALLKGIAAGVL